MPINMANLDAALAALTAQVTETETVEASATVLIEGFSAAFTKEVAAALEKDAAANNESIRVATEAIAATAARFGASEDKLGAALLANTPSAPPVEPPVV